MVKPLFSATHFRRNLISHGCHIVLKLQHYRVSCRAEKNSSHYLKVMVINMSNWFVTRIWSMASNKKYSPKFHSEFWNKDGLASLFSSGIPRKNEFFFIQYSKRTSCTSHCTLYSNYTFCLKIIFTYFYLNFRAKMEWFFGSEIQIKFTWIYGQKNMFCHSVSVS